jgi:adenylyltransferase/sulfurtransferase
MLAPDEEERYARQILIPELGVAGQERLRQARVLVAGLGGLGAPVSLYLAAAGVGSLRLVDADTVQLSNLNRQLLYATDDIGRRKAPGAQDRSQRLNPTINIEAVDTTMTVENVADLVRGCDLIVDALDNYPTRYVLNRASVSSRTPLLHGSVHGFDGMVTTLVPGETPCLRCIFPEPPPQATTPVLGATPGVVGCIQAIEAIKCLTGVGEALTGRLLLFDGLGLKFREVRVKRDPQCPECRDL